MVKIWNSENQLKYILQALSQNLNYTEPKFLRSFYIGFCKLIVKELKTHGIVLLPGLGRFELHVLMNRRWRNPTTGRMTPTGNVNQVKFIPTVSLNQYFKQLPPQPKISITEKMKRLKISRDEAKKLFDN